MSRIPPLSPSSAPAPKPAGAEHAASAPPDTARNTAERASLLRFAKICLAFLVGLAVTLCAGDSLVGLRLKRRGGWHMFGPEVFRTIRRSRVPDRRVNILFLGDSVARQLFTPGTEPGPRVRFLPTNQAISLAGQCYMLEDAVNACPAVTDVFLFYIPGCFANNLPPQLSHDYLCGYYHSPSQVLEIFRVKHDWDLSIAHVGRMLLPNLMMANSVWQTSRIPPAQDSPVPESPASPPPSGRDPLLSLLARCFATAADPPSPPAGSYGPALPPVSQYFLRKMRTICRERGIRLHVLPCPLSTTEQFSDSQHVYDAPPLRVDPVVLADAVHFQAGFISEYRRRVILAYSLPLPVTGPDFPSSPPRSIP